MRVGDEPEVMVVEDGWQAGNNQCTRHLDTVTTERM